MRNTFIGCIVILQCCALQMHATCHDCVEYVCCVINIIFTILFHFSQDPDTIEHQTADSGDMYALPQRRKKKNLNEVTQHYENMAKQKEHPFGVRAYVLAYHFITITTSFH